MKRIISLFMSIILILSLCSVPAKQVNAQTQEEYFTIRKADKILGICDEDDLYISDSDAKEYEYRTNLKYPSAYLVEDAKTRLGYESLLDIQNLINDKQYRAHPEYYYEAALMAVLFEQKNNTCLLDTEVLKFTEGFIAQVSSICGTVYSSEKEAYEALSDLEKSTFTLNDYENRLKECGDMLKILDVATKIYKEEKDMTSIVLKTQMYYCITTLREEMITFLGQMKDHTTNASLKYALDKIREVYIYQQEHPDETVKALIDEKTETLQSDVRIQWGIELGLNKSWGMMKKACPLLEVFDVTSGVVEFVNGKMLANDAIAAAYANMAAIYELEEAARETLFTAEKNYRNSDESMKVTFAGIFNAGWDLFTALIIADCEAAIAYADAVSSGKYSRTMYGMEGSQTCQEFKEGVKPYKSQTYVWRDRIRQALEEEEAEYIKVSEANFRKESITLMVGEYFTLSMKMTPTDACDQYVAYTSSDDSIVEIDDNLAFAKQSGTVTITGKAGAAGITDTMTINVIENSEPKILGDYEYKVYNNSCIIITKYLGNDTTVQIPAEIKGLPVERIEGFTGQDGMNSTVKEVILPDSVTQIGAYAFYRCTSLQKIDLKNIKYLEDYAFASCSSLKEAYLNSVRPEGLGIQVFDTCTSLTYVRFPDNMPTIPEGICRKCSSLTKVTFPKNLETIKYWAFWECGFEELEIPAGTSTLEASAIWRCPNLKTLILPGSIGLVDSDPIKFANNENTVYYTPSIAYMYRMFQYWEKDCNYKFNYKAFSNLKASVSSCTIYKGKTKTIGYSVAPKLSSYKVTYKSSNTSVATVSSSGVVTGKKKGTVTITLTGSDGQRMYQ